MMNIMPLVLVLIFIVPLFIITYFVMYPKNWQKKRFFFGIRNRKEYLENDAEVYITQLTNKARKNALAVLIIFCLFSFAILFIKDPDRQMILFTSMVIIFLVVISLPYMLGNYEMKRYKKQLGIEARSGLRYADITSINASHALNKVQMMVPVILTVIIFFISLLYDTGIISLGLKAGKMYAGSYIATGISGSFLFLSMLFVPMAVMMDNYRSSIVSEDSNENANYNRAMKKIWADVWIRLLWLNVIAMCLSAASIIFLGNEMASIIVLGLYFAGIVLTLGIFISHSSVLNKKYSDIIELENDDDDYWIMGMFYYNPSDSRLNVARRNETGGTINMAHPVGKIISVISILLFIFAVCALFWMAKVSETEMMVSISDGQIICHQLRDDYKIAVDDIVELKYGDNLYEMTVAKTAGVGTAKVLKGRYNINGESGCRVFINAKEKSYIKIVTDENTFYINEDSKEETIRLYDDINSMLGK